MVTINVIESFIIKEKICIITGAGGLLGKKHAEAILEVEGIPILIDIDSEKLSRVAKFLEKKYNKKIHTFVCDITKKEELEKVRDVIMNAYGRIDVLINNAANNPKVEENENIESWSRFENFSEKLWDKDLEVGLKGAFLCSKIFGTEMEKNRKGVILNISSDLGIIAPDQRIYANPNIEEESQYVKPVTYSVVKHALLGLTKYLATYWAQKGIRVNAICPGGVYNNQDDEFVVKLTNLIPMNRMATEDEYKGIIVFMVSDASSYMTGSTVTIDGGRTCW